jgi:hypothetical protein
MAAPDRIPPIDWRQAALVDMLLKLGEAQALKLDRRAALGHHFSLVIASAAKQ